MSIKSNYIKLPREFTVEPLASALSISAKFLYVILADRLELSEKNREFQDDDGTPFVYFTGEDLAVALGCSKRTVDRTLKELEDIGLIYRYRQYACKANKIYVRDIQKQLVEHSAMEEVEPEQPKQKKSIFSRFFSKKENWILIEISNEKNNG